VTTRAASVTVLTVPALPAELVALSVDNLQGTSLKGAKVPCQ